MNGPVLITGAAGQLGYELQRSSPADVRVIAADTAQLDLTDAGMVDTFVSAVRPGLIINCAAYTAVDRAESDVLRATAVNATAVESLARSASRCDARFIHISTDFVFGGAHTEPWRATDAPAPETVYGRTKRDGENAVLRLLGPRAVVLRTSWLYSAHGANFVKTMLRLMRDRESVRVVSDQVGTPTWAHSLAHTVWAIAARPDLSGLMHWSDDGVASWYEFAVAIQEEAVARGLLSRSIPVVAVSTSDYPTAARRPKYSVLDKSETIAAIGITPAHWRTNLRSMLGELAHA
jgi:dTDP-4-dehydrorhamnose reductase